MTEDEFNAHEPDLKTVFKAGWKAAFRYCNPEIGFGPIPNNMDEAWDDYCTDSKIVEK